jgi:hypothetical protein
MTSPVPSSIEDAAPLLVPRPVGVTPLAIRRLALALQNAESALDEVSPITADYAIGLYLDLPESNVPVTAGMLRDWDMPFAGALNFALLNGRAALAQVDRRDEDGAVHFTSSFLGAAVLASSETLRGLVDGRMMMVIPTPTDVVVAPATDSVAVEALARIADALVSESDRTVSVTPLIAEAGEPWAAAPWPASADMTAGLLYRRWIGIQYARQRDLLRETYDDRGEVCAVSSAQVARRPDGWVVTMTNLTTFLPTLMPWTDEAAIVADDGRVVSVPMTQLSAIPGVLVREPDLDPPIMRAVRFPSELFD